MTNNLILNPDKTTCTLFTPDPAEYSTPLELQIDNITLTMNINPKILGLTLDPKLTYTKHIEIITTKGRKTIQIQIWGKQKDTIIATYKAIRRSILEYVSPIWSPQASDTNINKLQITQNTALRIATHNIYTTKHTHSTHKGTLPTTRITDKTKITTTHTPTTLHHNTTNNTQT